jgi:hypothetical protein
MLAGGWVASDATIYSLEDERPDWLSLVSVAIAVDDMVEFEDKYTSIIETKLQDHGIQFRHPIIKNSDINQWTTDWERKEVRKDIGTSLLQIDNIDNLQIVETSLHSEWVTIYREQENHKNKRRSEKFIEHDLQSYYNLISIWEYLRKSEDRPTTHRNVLTDDFSGKTSPAWTQIGKMSNEIHIIPKGDETYPLLSLADLTLELVKQEVDDWHEQDIYEYLREITPDDSAWIDSDGIDEERELRNIAPHRKYNINTAQHYPSPTYYIDTTGVGKDTLRSTEFYNHILRLAWKTDGCVKLFEEKQDREYMTSEDFLIAMDGNTGRYSYLEELNDTAVPTILDIDETKDKLHNELGAFAD